MEEYFVRQPVMKLAIRSAPHPVSDLERGQQVNGSRHFHR